ncbi:unnamed protein product [Brachionus calyciflorus]|uniref:Uncharacterized protein n=1 Tax=Brachionus calyciflorus TaxID=104777 RepID=A0A814GLC0_9BILA|nr:unnamed protein product [Brachionus calyciflorus]
MGSEFSEDSINVSGNSNSPIDLDVNTDAYINENLDFNINGQYEVSNDVEDSFVNNENYQQLIDAYHRMFNKYYSKYLIAKNVSKEIWMSINEKVYYIPILENLKSILKNKVIKNEFFKKKASSNNCISSFYDSKRYDERKFFSSFSDTIQKKRFIDECEACNPIGDNRKKYKMTGVYFKIGNLGNRFQSVNQLTFLVMLFKSQFLKNYRYASILKRLHQDLRFFETDGIIVKWNGELFKNFGIDFFYLR